MWKFVASVLLIAVLGQLQVEAYRFYNWKGTEMKMPSPPVDCSVVKCAAPDCPNPITPPGQCCAVCPKPPIDCTFVKCAAPDCPNPITPPGQCCAVCPKPPIDCTFVKCAAPDCPNPITPPGQCCAVCPKPPIDCTLVKCAAPDCPNQCCTVCPGRCPIKGQVYKQCGTACPPTCADPFPELCPLICVPGCQCPQGTVLDEKAQKCVLVKECSRCPIKGQVYKQCGTACPPTCADPFPELCPLICVPGCQCPQGTVLDEKAQKCVLVKECNIIG